jgi:hypothetical protein
MEGFVMSAAMVLVCALEVLGRSAASLPPIELIFDAPPGVAANVEAFVRPGSGIITLLTSSDAFVAASHSGCREYNAVAKIASLIAHEEWHVTHGADERGAYEAQLSALMRSGVAPSSRVFVGVVRSMHAVLESKDSRLDSRGPVHR